MTHWSNALGELNACHDVIRWAKTQPSYQQAWRVCPRGDWLLWLAVKLGVSRKLVVLATCDCAETTLKFVPPGEDRPAEAIRVARLWCHGEATISEVLKVADAVDAAAAAAYAAAAAAAAYAAYAAADAAAAYVSKAQQKKLATIVRRRIERPKLPSEI